ncbi:hypothetical protein KHQ81_01685 [Mycoplasmatota bacterium]|nr:hypothetical protein KHQ81_01685 [Mycoplasmatota bacterium]
MTIQLKKAQRLIQWNVRKMYLHSKRVHQKKWIVKRGEVFFVDLGENVGSEEN